ncbi:MAG: hypothetical protein CVU03_04510 [Bacteroidetes bacterium HGW-Bacteroidetes-2]|jgi:hypothetical protein|nr:MAG: hypothetical protein CVU03_04510 [Bacteroidetes bacterium HGW-Bacteroidetes-2]
MKKHCIALHLNPYIYNLRSHFFLFILFNIGITFCNSFFAQEIYLEILGKDSSAIKAIKEMNLLSVFKNFKSLQAQVDTSEVKLQKLGYIHLQKSDILKKNDSTFSVLFDLKTKYEKLRIFFPDSLEQFGLSLKDVQKISKYSTNTYFIIDFVQLENTLNTLNSRIVETGFPFSYMQLKDIKPSLDSIPTLDAQLVVVSNTKRKITGIEIKGYENFPKSYLKYALGIKNGMLFQKQKITEKSNLLNNLGFAKNTKAPEVLFTNEETRLYLYIEKKNNNLFDGIIGFATNEESKKLEFSGYLNLVLNNNLNYGEKFAINYKNDGNEQQQFRVNTELPYVFKSPIGLELELQFFKKDSTYLTVEKQILANFQFNTNTRFFIGYKDYESTNLLEEQNPGDLVIDYTSAFLIFGAQFTKQQNNGLFPIKTSARIGNEIGSRKNSALSTNQFRTKVMANHIFQLNNFNSIYLNNQTEILTGDNYFINELFRFGGINSIRGFDENSIDATLFTVLNTEYRYQLGNDTYIHSIMDIAYFENKITTTKSQLYSFGVGLGLKTKAGIFKLNIANGKLEDQSFTFSNTKIHLSLTAVF